MRAMVFDFASAALEDFTATSIMGFALCKAGKECGHRQGRSICIYDS
jgi:hypothetical protein